MRSWTTNHLSTNQWCTILRLADLPEQSTGVVKLAPKLLQGKDKATLISTPVFETEELKIEQLNVSSKLTTQMRKEVFNCYKMVQKRRNCKEK